MGNALEKPEANEGTADRQVRFHCWLSGALVGSHGVGKSAFLSALPKALTKVKNREKRKAAKRLFSCRNSDFQKKSSRAEIAVTMPDLPKDVLHVMVREISSSMSAKEEQARAQRM